MNENKFDKVNILAKAVEQKFVQELLHTEGKELNMQTSSSEDHESLSPHSPLPFNKELIKPPTDADALTEVLDRVLETRDRLPAERDPANKPSIWKVLKDMIGKDLSRFAIPVYFNEPLSMMQKFAESVEYYSLLNEADKTDDPKLRMLYVTVFAITQYTAQDGRLQKPFNPLLGETYELLTPDFKLFAEQVSHHPPVTAVLADSDNWSYEADTDAKIVFNGTFVKAVPIGEQVIRLKQKNEVYVVSRPVTYVNNILFGKMYNEQVGIMKVRNKTNEMHAEIEFKAEGWGGRNRHNVSGYICENEQAFKKKQFKNSYFVYGKYSEYVHAWKTDAKGAHADTLTVEPDLKVWKANPPIERRDFYYNMS